MLSIPSELKKQGFVVICWGPIWTAESDDLAMLYDNTNVIRISIKKAFQKWENSTDFIVTILPKNDIEVKAMVEAANYLRQAGLFDHQWGRGLNINARMQICLKKHRQSELAF